jgi:hypothetical protein
MDISWRFSKLPSAIFWVATLAASMVVLTLERASPKKFEKDLASASEGAVMDGRLVEMLPMELVEPMLAEPVIWWAGLRFPMP